MVDVSLVVAKLKDTLNESDAVRNNAEKALESVSFSNNSDIYCLPGVKVYVFQFRSQPGYLSALLEILMNPNLPLDGRHSATLQFKNTVDAFWLNKPTRPSPIPAGEKDHIRRNLLAVSNPAPCACTSEVIDFCAAVDRKTRAPCVRLGLSYCHWRDCYGGLPGTHCYA